jgi:SAM-dependent methyltransferase
MEDREAAVSVKTTWGAGDYPRMAELLRPAAAATVELAAVRPGERVVDVASGTGNAALVACERGAETTAVDFEPSLLARGRETAAREGLHVAWLEGDAQELPLPDGYADAVVSVFGVMYAAEHDAAASELARVTRATGRIALAAWIPGSFLPALGGVFARYLPPAAPSDPPGRWGDLEALSKLLNRHRLEVVSHRVAHLDLPVESAERGADLLINTAGHVVSARERLVADRRWDDLWASVAEFVQGRAKSSPVGDVVRLEYLLALARPCRGAS